MDYRGPLEKMMQHLPSVRVFWGGKGQVGRHGLRLREGKTEAASLMRISITGPIGTGACGQKRGHDVGGGHDARTPGGGRKEEGGTPALLLGIPTRLCPRILRKLAPSAFCRGCRG